MGYFSFYDHFKGLQQLLKVIFFGYVDASEVENMMMDFEPFIEVIQILLIDILLEVVF